MGTLLRQAVWSRIESNFSKGEHILDMGCGTGEDAMHMAGLGLRVMGVDASDEMVRVARNKVSKAGLDHAIRIFCEDLEILMQRTESILTVRDTCKDARPRPFDGALFNFGVINCLNDLSGLSLGLSRVIRPGGRILLCVMGRYVPWEWFWFLIHGLPQKGFRRMKKNGCRWHSMTIRYPGIRQVTGDFQEHFRKVHLQAVGVLLPPPYTSAWCEQNRKMLAVLARLENRLSKLPPLPWLADHYLLELERM